MHLDLAQIQTLEILILGTNYPFSRGDLLFASFETNIQRRSTEHFLLRKEREFIFCPIEIQFGANSKSLTLQLYRVLEDNHYLVGFAQIPLKDLKKRQLLKQKLISDVSEQVHLELSL